MNPTAPALLLCCRAESRHDVSVFFIPERSILCERLLKQVSWLPVRHLPPAADNCHSGHGKELP
jgi:hypothetical protein